ncbi:hypothetical protein DSM112329_02490 [Paraconexibacter sp. AEG42_29]|uniref:Mce/MlaD domain-containing protein n=1 Tax=Paraconexibacter sp. AEG42_29 TaxID=2997339 RepID=A0AAU7AVG1_9ACTN
MTRARIIGPSVLLVVAALLFIGLSSGASDDDGSPRYFVELDNAFGLVDGGDVKIAGVRAGTVASIGLQRKGMRARVEIEVTDRGFGDLRTDSRCESRAQSLLGEYFLDCQPGVKAERMQDGDTIPVERTAGTVPLDLIQDIMRRPTRERWSIFLSELGVGLAGRGEDLNTTIRRADPALRETNRLLKALEDERTTIRDLYQDADTVLARLRTRRADVGRFFAESRDTARATARERPALARQFQLLPGFLRELSPTMNRLREAAVAQRPAVQKLGEQATRLAGLLDAVPPFADAARPATAALAKAARESRPALLDARAPIGKLRQAARTLPEATTNLRFILEHLDDPAFAVEKDERAGHGKDGGFSGLESLMRYVWAQSQAINVYSGTSYNLKVTTFSDGRCGPYADAARAQDSESARCRAWLGPNQPGVTSPDFTKYFEEEQAPQSAATISQRDDSGGAARPERRPAPATTPAAAPGAATAPAAPSKAPSVPEALDRLLTGVLGAGGLLPKRAPQPAPAPPREGQASLLDFLLKP